MPLTEAQQDAIIASLQADDKRVQGHIVELYRRIEDINDRGDRLTNYLQANLSSGIPEWRKPL